MSLEPRPDNKRTRIDHDPADAVPEKPSGPLGWLRHLLREWTLRRTSTKRCAARRPSGDKLDTERCNDQPRRRGEEASR
jgi:hypothetical protein